MKDEQLTELRKAAGSELPRAWPAPPWKGLYRCSPEDFQVEEELGFEPDGEGEHLFLWVEKTGTNTGFLAEELARRAAIPAKNVSFSGLKDRHAVTRQWFSLHLPGQADPELSQLNSDHWQVLKAVRHSKKLKRGVHRGNHFRLRIRIDQANASTGDWLEERWKLLQEKGVPNYFGPQRFGQGGQNINRALQWLTATGKRRKARRQDKSLWLSSLRSALFNLWLAEAIAKGDWNQALQGGCFNLAASRSRFSAGPEEVLEAIQARVDQLDLHPTGPLAGQGRPEVADQALEREQDFFTPWQELVELLANQGLHQERRSQRLVPEQTSFVWEAPWLTLGFYLPAGSFATSLLREIVKAQDAQQSDYGKLLKCSQ
ncbi:tRNA pseudouridine(13) synthase TruD [Marinospirillum sp.]|uniref:tRNA pseudouridine(13) synthase TruD n=1 Tax=Marinospirillum sp. TaxID=2183934 RepID=UPI0028707DDA|nr:tRNA pseudouridine(13) synthase TruD [Marinospirillum sp.]MDR9469215.1 tRNA pseudouridine(13) synthase TruD [Marinospirillum sp.]